MTEMQKEFLKVLEGYGLSMTVLMVVGTYVKSKKDIKEMSGRILEAVDAGKEVTDGLIGQILYDMMVEANLGTIGAEPDEE